MSIEAGCNGIETCLIFTTAVLAYPASWQMRMTGVGLGFVALQAVNLLRIIVLFYLAGQSEAVFRFAHLYLWQALIMLDVLVVWLVPALALWYWARDYRPLNIFPKIRSSQPRRVYARS